MQNVGADGQDSISSVNYAHSWRPSVGISRFDDGRRALAGVASLVILLSSLALC